MNKSDDVYLQHIRDSILLIQKYTASGKAAFLDDKMMQDAVIRNIEIIGEATKRLSNNVTVIEPEIPWKRIAGMRDKLIHDYFGVNVQLVWETVAKEMPVLLDAVNRLLRSLV